MLITTFKAPCATETTSIRDANVGRMVMIVPIAEITLPTTIRTGPTAAANNATFTIVSFVLSSRLLNLSTHC